MSGFAKCDKCRHYWQFGELREARDLAERVDADGPEPAGECPECGALAYPFTPRADGPDCRNCGRPHAGIDACLVGVIVQLVNDRGDHQPPVTAEDVARISADPFWNGANELIDWVGDHIAWRRANAGAPTEKGG